MPRRDLLALVDEDLAALASLGMLKRARRELGAGQVSVALEESEDGTVSAHWSDGVSCTLPAGRVLGEGRCSCPAPTLCRHLLRTVLAYQQQQASSAAKAAPVSAEPSNEQVVRHEAWDPGRITDEQLAAALRRPVLDRAHRAFEAGELVELVRSTKPTARFHGLACAVRFMVPGDVRYTRCDCGDSSPCVHAAIAVLAFRRLAESRSSGYVSMAPGDAAAVPDRLFEELESALVALAELGVSGPSALRDRLRRAARRTAQAGLVWPAEILEEIVDQLKRYASHDGRFEAERVPALIGELLIRLDALRADTGAVPAALVRGVNSDRELRLGKARLVGLGCGARVDCGAPLLSAYLQDAGSGTVVALERAFSEPAGDETPPALADLAARVFHQSGASLAALGAGQLLVDGARRSPSHRLTLGRSRVGFNPQPFAWEELRAPVLAGDLAEVRARLGGLPPTSLRPRRVAEDLHVCALAAVEDVAFCAARQTVEATLVDPQGGRARLSHPYTARGASGCEALLHALSGVRGTARFISGAMRLEGAELVVAPLAIVLEGTKGRQAVQPWVDRLPADAPSLATSTFNADPGEDGLADPTLDFPLRLLGALGSLLLLGLQRATASTAAEWREICRAGEALGFNRLLAAPEHLAALLEAKRGSISFDAAPAARRVLEVAKLARLASELR